MRIAIPINENKGLESTIAEHFGRALFYIFIDISNSKITSFTIEKNEFTEHSPGLIPKFLHSRGVNVVIARGMGWRAREWFNKLGISVITGAYGRVKDILNLFLSGKLESKPFEPKHKCEKY